MANTNHAQHLAHKIRNWDKARVTTLRDMINDLHDYCRSEDMDAGQFIDMASLPTVEIPADVDTSYPVWAMDADGNLLVGDTAQEIETLAKYREGRG